MQNPNKIYGVEKVILERENDPKTTISQATIFQQMGDEVKDLYKITSVPKTGLNKAFNGDSYDVQVFIPEHQKDPDIPINFRLYSITDINNLIFWLKKRFNYGRYKLKNVWYTLPNAFSRNLTYREVRKLLLFERRSSRFIDEKPECIRKADPIFMQNGDIIDCSTYAIEAWYKRRNKKQYSCITFDHKIFDWLNNYVSK